MTIVFGEWQHPSQCAVIVPAELVWFLQRLILHWIAAGQIEVFSSASAKNTIADAVIFNM